VAFALVIIPYGIYPVAVFFYSIRPSSSTPFISAPDNNIMASALRRSPGGSTSPMVYVPYDVPLVVIFLLFPPPVIARL